MISYTYDADSELTGVSDANATLTFTYDSGGRQLTAATSGTAGQPNVTLTSGYDQPTATAPASPTTCPVLGSRATPTTPPSG